MQGLQDINPDTSGGFLFSFSKYANEDTKGPIRAPSWTMSFWHSLQPKNKSWRPDPTKNNDSIAYVLSAYFPPINLSTNIPILYDTFLTSLYEKHIFMRQNTITSDYKPDILLANFTCTITPAMARAWLFQCLSFLYYVIHVIRWLNPSFISSRIYSTPKPPPFLFTRE